jgi:hypothetical protein
LGRNEQHVPSEGRSGRAELALPRAVRPACLANRQILAAPPQLTCGITNEGTDYPMYPGRTGKVGARFVWFAGDPINDVNLGTAPFSVVAARERLRESGGGLGFGRDSSAVLGPRGLAGGIPCCTLTCTRIARNRLNGLGLALALGLFVLIYLRSPSTYEETRGCSDCGEYLGRWWNPGSSSSYSCSTSSAGLSV